jgi:hypothetical protein
VVAIFLSKSRELLSPRIVCHAIRDLCIFILSTPALCSTAGVEVKKACEFLLSRQMEDGGWGEDFAVYNTTY